MAVADSVEAVLTEIGFGRWQGLVLVIVLLFHAIVPVQQIGSPLLSAPVPFRCSYPDYIDVTNLTSSESVGYQNVLTDDETLEYPSQCLPVVDALDLNSIHLGVLKVDLKKRATGLPSCPFVEYDTSVFESTVITEFNLVCESSTLTPLFQMTYAIGAIAGSFFCGQLSDWLGRKRTIQLGAIIATIGISATSIAPWYNAVIAMRILTGLATILMLFPCYTLLSEVSPSSSRTITAMVPGMTYFAFMGVLAGATVLLPHWRKLLLLCNSPLVILVPLTFMMDESPRWLLQNGRTTEAVEILRKAASQNGVTISSTTSSILDKLSLMGKDATIMKPGADGEEAEDIGTLRMLRVGFSSPGMRTILTMTPIMWFLLRTLYVGIIVNANNFTSSNPFEYVALLGAMGVVSMIISIPLSLKLTRRVFVAGTLLIAGLLMFTEMAVPTEIWYLKWAMVMIAFCLVCASFQVNYIFAAELFPTVIRTRGFTFSNLIGSVGEMCIPIVTDIAVRYQWWAPAVTFGLAGIVGAVVLPLLPETKDKPMPETLRDVEDRFFSSYQEFIGNDIIVVKGKHKSKIAFQV